MVIFGFDPAKVCGYAIMDSKRHLSAIECGVIKLSKDARHYSAFDEIAEGVERLIEKHGKPDFAVLEEALKAQVRNSNADAIIYAWGASVAITTVMQSHGIAYGTIPSGTWRKGFFGTGYTPPLDKRGQKDWKAAAVSICEREGIQLPTQKTIAHNAAEACAVAVCWHRAKIHRGRYRPAFQEMLQGRMGRAS